MSKTRKVWGRKIWENEVENSTILIFILKKIIISSTNIYISRKKDTKNQCKAFNIIRSFTIIFSIIEKNKSTGTIQKVKSSINVPNYVSLRVLKVKRALKPFELNAQKRKLTEWLNYYSKKNLNWSVAMVIKVKVLSLGSKSLEFNLL